MHFFLFMPESFLGDLSQVKLFDILKPLFTGKKTGRVHIKGKENGEICLDRGDVVHSRTDHFSGENAFFKIMGWKDGKITFEAGAAPQERTIPIATEQLLLNWSSRKQEFEKIQEAIPSSHTLFRLSLQRDGKEKHITADQWNVIVLCNGMKSLIEIAASLEWEEYRVLKTVYQLVRMGLLERAEERSATKKKTVKENFFAILEMELKRVMGPVAPFVIDDKLAEFGESKGSFPQERALLFVEALGEEVPQPLKRNEFLKETIKALSL